MESNALITELLESSAHHHTHLCPRQVLGVRMGLHAGELLGITLPQNDKSLFTLIETDGCFLDGVVESTGCSVGARTMKVYDFGKIAATFVNRKTGRAYRIIPNPSARETCAAYSPTGVDKWHAYLAGYEVMPVEELFIVNEVHLSVSIDKLISTPKAKVICAACGEEVFNEREITRDGHCLCKSCAGVGYIAHDSPII